MNEQNIAGQYREVSREEMQDINAKRAAIADPWVHRSSGMRCVTCIWFVPKELASLGTSKVGRCRRHAPTMGGYPVVYMTDWCGDHRIDENKA